jgi:fructose-1,6-bisphosphatase I
MQTLDQSLQMQSIPAPLASVILTLAGSCAKISALVERGELAGVLGATEQENVQGETQKKLDVIANDLLKNDLQLNVAVAAIASEEEDESVAMNEVGQYLVAFDPLDGSSNIDINGQIGTIFSVLPRVEALATSAQQQFLQPGKHQRAAGYALYGASTQLVLNLGKSTQVFTLDPDGKHFVLTQDTLGIPVDTQEFSINMSNQRFWFPAMQRYVQSLLEGEMGPRGKRYNMRWNASMVGDVHRVLLRGGIFMYPSDNRSAQQPAKLRLLYEANPMAMLVEGAGGKAFTERERILDLKPTTLHQRVAVLLGSAGEVDTCYSYHTESIPS